MQSVIEAIALLDKNDPASDQLASYLYIADSRLSDYLDQLRKFTQLESPTLPESKKGGELLEQIAFLTFQGLKGATSLKSFQSAGPQYDLLVSGDQLTWLHVCHLLYLKENQRGIVVEAKATKQRLPDNQSGGSRQRAISNCRLRQVLFHAKTQKLIIVLDKDDIFELGKNGTLIQILVRKIRDLCELSGLPTTPICEPKEIDLPKHLKQLYEAPDT